jgi:primosomal protein N' (replication factor Y)
VLVQTWHPDHHAIRMAVDHDFGGFARRELRLRKGLWYPPYSRLTMLKLSATDERAARDAAQLTRRRIDELVGQIASAPGQLQARGPAPAPMYRIKGRFRWQVLVKGHDHQVAGELLRRLDAGRIRDEVKALGGQARLVIDRDPVSLL